MTAMTAHTTGSSDDTVSSRSDSMRAMVLERQRTPLVGRNLPIPQTGPSQVRVRVSACGVCRTDLHVCDGDLKHPKNHLIPGHEIVGYVDSLDANVQDLDIGQRVGIPWLGWTCGTCVYCRADQENLCENARFTGYTLDGGYGEYAAADARYVFPVHGDYSDAEVAPLLCAGLIGYRSLRMAGDGKRLGLYGFGAAAHIVAQVATWQGRELYAFVRPGDTAAKSFAEELGAVWAGDSDTMPPELLDAAIIYAPVGDLVPAALRAVRPGGTVICAGIHMSDIPSFPYEILWRERSIQSVANLTRRDGEEFLELAPKVPVKTSVETFPLSQANEALDRLRAGKLRGAAVLTMDP